LLADNRDVAVAAAGHHTILDPCGIAKLLNQEKAADKKQEDDHYTCQTRCLSLGRFIIGLMLWPVTMRVH
jgi:hypothetical protein